MTTQDVDRGEFPRVPSRAVAGAHRIAAFSTAYTATSGLCAGGSWGFAAHAQPLPAVALGMASGFVFAFAVAHIAAMLDTLARRRST